MKHISFKFLAGIMIAAILILVVVAARLAIAILDTEVNRHRAETLWPTAVIERRTATTFWVSETPRVVEITVMPSLESTAIPALPSDEQAFPSRHPMITPNAPCIDCHQIIHQGSP